MKLVDLKSRANRPLTINLTEKERVSLPAVDYHRLVEQKDKKSGELRAKETVVRCPPVIRIPANGTVTGLPKSVLQHPVVQSFMRRTPGRRPQLLLLKEYDSND